MCIIKFNILSNLESGFTPFTSRSVVWIQTYGFYKIFTRFDIFVDIRVFFCLLYLFYLNSLPFISVPTESGSPARFCTAYSKKTFGQYKYQEKKNNL